MIDTMSSAIALLLLRRILTSAGVARLRRPRSGPPGMAGSRLLPAPPVSHSARPVAAWRNWLAARWRRPIEVAVLVVGVKR
jgi:hypothetical protein